MRKSNEAQFVLSGDVLVLLGDNEAHKLLCSRKKAIEDEQTSRSKQNLTLPGSRPLLHR